MSNSKRYRQLVSRVNSIERHLLPPIKISGNYTRKEQDYLRAYRLLIHAEFESYFEDRAKEKVLAAFRNWQSTRKKSAVLLAIVTFSNLANSPIISKKETEKRVHEAVTHFVNCLVLNNGIKEKDLLAILLPIGIEFSELNQLWLNDMNSFGISRGAVAHSSARALNPIDPVVEKAFVSRLLVDIQILDEKINQLS